MFQVKHQITLANGFIFSLYGEDYFGDKRVFWESHQTQLEALIKKVQEVGTPITVVEFPKEEHFYFEEVTAFKQWLSKYHPVNF